MKHEGADPVTYNMVFPILQDEVEHEEDLQALHEDFDLLMMRIKIPLNRCSTAAPVLFTGVILFSSRCSWRWRSR